ncbi:Piso0_004995 [Millerozyma farinosa CBS 7064]|uniref:Piso0_004995 protein n=1 Tax=Pichia sorbitophila (strain ATCC MYA-4447 / BCRC 22081 / CBS 7064 / NBRC 10061 / NRRL Y-12695) TaxID=559304 RepID=G8Y0Z7_PICSO|nr:Piso0_004995 [Millerozyma farinosa CBS 7064]
MSLWVDKYRPKKLDQLSYHNGLTENLKALASTGDFPHLLVYGPPGSGKKTRIYGTLYELYGPQVEKLKIDVNTFTTTSNRKLEFNVLSSAHHLEITPSDMGNNDRVVIQDLLKDVASVEQVDFSNSAKSKSKHRFKVVIINEADSLSKDAQAALRRTMEKYSANIRLILVSNTTSGIIAPIKSRTLLVRVPAPSETDIADILSGIAKKEGLKFKPDTDNAKQELFRNIALHSEKNLRRTLLCFETLSMQSETINIDKNTLSLVSIDWEVIIANLAKSIVANKSVANIAKSRVVLYELLSHCIPARTILKRLLFDLISLNNYNDNITQELTEYAALFDERLSLGQKSIFHLEGFVARAMLILDK